MDEGRARRSQARDRLWTVGDVLDWTARRFAEEGFSSARLDAELLLAHVLGTDRVGLYLDYHKPLTQQERGAYRQLVARRLKGEPVAYILGHKEFWSLDLKVDGRVLVPRPETELLVDKALELLAGHAAGGRRDPERGRGLVLLDVGTGSGAIALALARELPGATVVATDVSEDALEVARENATQLGLEVEFRLGSLYEPVADLAGQVDLVVSNPPYVAEASPELEEPVRRHEPPVALLAGPEGLDVLLPLLEGAPAILKPGGWLLLEFGVGQAEVLQQRARALGAFEHVEVARDLAGHPRCFVARLGGA